MKLSVPRPDGLSVIEVNERVLLCAAPGCNGRVVRHSLGVGQSIDRCTRCFRRHQVREQPPMQAQSGRLRRMLDEFVSWREDGIA